MQVLRSSGRSKRLNQESNKAWFSSVASSTEPVADSPNVDVGRIRPSHSVPNGKNIRVIGIRFHYHLRVMNLVHIGSYDQQPQYLVQGIGDFQICVLQ